MLASQSPRRRELLAAAGYDFVIVPPRDSAECGICSRETPGEMVSRLAFQKAEDVVQRLAEGAAADPGAPIVLACDTVAECRGHILGKPKNRQHAREMLELLRGSEHRVYSGLCLWRRADSRRLVQVAVSRLRMDAVSDSDLDAYLDTGAWEGKAGAFGFQDRLNWIHLLEGSESNVVGLPMELLQQLLAELERM